MWDLNKISKIKPTNQSLWPCVEKRFCSTQNKRKTGKMNFIKNKDFCFQKTLWKKMKEFLHWENVSKWDIEKRTYISEKHSWISSDNCLKWASNKLREIKWVEQGKQGKWKEAQRHCSQSLLIPAHWNASVTFPKLNLMSRETEIYAFILAVWCGEHLYVQHLRGRRKRMSESLSLAWSTYKFKVSRST